MAVEMSLGRDWPQGEIEPAGFGFARQKLFEQKCMRGDLFGLRPRQHCGQLIAKREDAAWLKADNWNTARHERHQCTAEPAGFLSRFVNQAGAQEGAPTA